MNNLAPHLSKIIAFDVAHEPDTSGQKCFPGDPNAKTKMAALLFERSQQVKDTWPGARTYATYASAEMVTGPLAQNIDWNGFDCYGPFDNCFGTGISISQIVDAMAIQLNAQQSIFLISDASCFFYDYTGRKTHESELFMRAIQYWQLAVTHPRIKGMIGFLWGGTGCTLPPPDPVNEIDDSPGLMTLYRNIGLNVLTGVLPSIPAFNVPTECQITSGTTCGMNVSWAEPTLRLFGRLAGNQDTWAGPLSPGATSCSVPAGPGDYIFELRENDSSSSKLIWAKPTEVRYASGVATGQIVHTPTICTLQTHGSVTFCNVAFSANVQNVQNPALPGFFLAGSTTPLCGENRTSVCVVDASSLPVGGPYSFTVQLRASVWNPTSQLLDQRTFSFTVTQ